jgi:hypothetical protein
MTLPTQYDQAVRPPTVVQTPWLTVMSLAWNVGQGERKTTFYGTPKFPLHITPSEIFMWVMKAARRSAGLDPQAPIVVIMYHVEPDVPVQRKI